MMGSWVPCRFCDSRDLKSGNHGTAVRLNTITIFSNWTLGIMSPSMCIDS